VKKTDQNGWTCFHFAAQGGCDKTLRVLIESVPNSKALLAQKCNDGQDCLAIAMSFGNEDCAKLLRLVGSSTKKDTFDPPVPQQEDANQAKVDTVCYSFFRSGFTTEQVNKFREENDLLLGPTKDEDLQKVEALRTDKLEETWIGVVPKNQEVSEHLKKQVF
jgi:hypothetical protein